MKFSHFIQLMKQNSQPDKEDIRSRVLKTAKPRWIKRTAIACIAAIIIGAAGTAGYFMLSDAPHGKENHLPDELRKLSTIAAVTTDADSSRIPTDSVFEITTVKKENEKSVRDAIKITPDTEYTLKKTSGNTYELSFGEKLRPNTLYTIKSVSGQKSVYSWAFQTENSFEITSVSPSGGYAADTSAVWVEFSHSDVDDFEQHFSITPSISGTFEHYGKRWVFIPAESFELNTVYTVTISQDLSCTDGQSLEEDCVFSFEARGDSFLEYDYLDFNAKCETFTTEQTPGARVRFSDVDTDSATVNVYSIATADEFIKIHKKYITDGLISSSIADELKKEVLSFEAKPTAEDQTAYFNYPEKLDAGYYISSITFEHGVVYHIFQVTDIAVYTVSSNGNCTVWVNDLTAKKPLAGVSITADNGDISATDSNGIAVMKDHDDEGLRYLSVGAKKPYVAIVTNSEGTDYADYSLDYYSYITSNSLIYRAGDTVKVWGFTLPRVETASQSYELYCSFTDKKVKISPDESGAFTAEFKISKGETAEGGYIDFLVDGVVLTSRYFTIENYLLPTYALDISTDKDKYVAGEAITYTVYAELFDGTPAESITVVVGEQEIVTNSRGLATYTKTASIPEDVAYDSPFYDNVEFYVVQPDGESVFYHIGTTVFASETHIKDIKDDGEKLTVSTEKYDGGEAADQSITAELHRVTYEKSESLEGFDPVTMEKVLTYSYSAIDEVVSTQEYLTEKAVAEIPYETEDEAVYYMLLICGNNKYTHYISGNDWYIPQEYSLEGDDSYSVGDIVSLKLAQDIEDGMVMISTIAGDILTNDIYSPDKIIFEFTEAHCPDALVAGAYFDGTQVLPIELKWIFEKERQLDVDITADKESYSPGDTVTLSLNVKDSTGTPVKAGANINVVDKALDMLMPDNADIYSDVHFSRSHIAMVYRTVSTYLTKAITDAYGEGGGGGDNVRTDFEDTPYFESVTTDDKGKATVSFKLPDSITSWVIRAKAFDTTAAAGQCEIQIAATKDLFITPYIADTIDPDDEASFAFRFNSKDAEGKCEYNITLSKDGNEIDSAKGEAEISQIKNESFGKLEQGHYTITISGGNDEHQDSIQKQFTVKSRQSSVISVKEHAIGEKISADTFKSDISVAIYDKEYELYYAVINEMLSKVSSRIDHRIANAVANAVLSGNSNEFTHAERLQIAEYMTDSGICIYESDSYTTPLQSALITAVLQNRVYTDDVRYYFEDIISNFPDTSTLIAYDLAFAALGEPVLDDLKVLYSGISQFTDEQKAYLALAYAYAGDYNTATAIFNEHLESKILTANGVSKFSADTPYETEYMTCLAACLTSKISNTHAKDLIKGLIGGDDYTVTGLAFCVFAENYIPYLEGENTVKYTKADGTTQTLTYKRTESLSVKVANEDIEKVRFESQSGNSVMAVSGRVDADTLYGVYTENEGATVKISADKTAPNDGDTVMLTVDISVSECNMVSPYAKLILPHGIKAIKTEVYSDSGYCSSGLDPHEVEIYITGDEISLGIECYAAIEGEYIIHAPAVVDDATDQYAVGENIEITVK